MAIWYLSGNLIYFPVLVYCIKKNLATLDSYPGKTTADRPSELFCFISYYLNFSSEPGFTQRLRQHGRLIRQGVQKVSPFFQLWPPLKGRWYFAGQKL
jgi:hypothetical protein